MPPGILRDRSDLYSAVLRWDYVNAFTVYSCNECFIAILHYYEFILFLRIYMLDDCPLDMIISSEVYLGEEQHPLSGII